MAEFQSYITMGEDLGLKGKELIDFAKGLDAQARDERQKEREHQRGLKEYELRIAEENAKSRSSGKTDVDPSKASPFKKPEIPCFNEKTDEIDSYLKRFERYAIATEKPKSDWAMLLSALLTGKALTVYSRLSDDDYKNYDTLKKALLFTYELNADGFRRKFRGSKPEGGETYAQFVERITGYLKRWVDLSNTDKSFEGMLDLMVRDQFYGVCSKELRVFVKEGQPTSVKDMAARADRYVEARGKQWDKKGSTKPGPSNKLQSEQQADKLREWNKNKKCYNCSELGHVSRDCKKPKGYNASKGRNDKAAGLADESDHTPEVKERAAACQTDSEVLVGELKLRSGLPKVSAVETNQECMPVREGYIGSSKVSVLRDTGCSTVVARKQFVDNSMFTGINRRCVLLDGTVRDVPVAIVSIDTPYYQGEVEALVMESPLYDLILGNISGAREPQDPDPDWAPPQYESVGNDSDTVSGAVETRAQRKKRGKPLKPLRTANSEELNIGRDELIQAQKDESKFAKFYDLSKTDKVKVTRSGNEVRFVVVNNVLFRKFKLSDSKGDKEFRQVMVPERFRNKVMSVGHEAPLSGHLGVKKTYDRIASNFYWPGIQKDVKMFCMSCDICQRTISKGKISKVQLGRMPLIDTPFHRVAIDLVGPLAPVSDQGNRYILTLVDYATRFPEAVALPSIETERVAEALLGIFTRSGIANQAIDHHTLPSHL
ncbi:Protein NYNRIN [Holothuria leucospilota]|uniref:Protein NYNRIN n=1 Tax=Holothuria leucospilota TaxID=206669 RepID=A0A9Q1C399_HOLLE|nr:Protein NYNRIN [Holothuria leucospilota]